MPDPGRYKDKAHFMSDCMRMTKQEGLTNEQGIGKCLGIWRGEHGGKQPPKKTAVHDLIRETANNLLIR